MTWEDYRVGVPRRKQYKLIMNSDDVRYGGKGEERRSLLRTSCRLTGLPYSSIRVLGAGICAGIFAGNRNSGLDKCFDIH